jgi:STE24 endopeptidase
MIFAAKIPIPVKAFICPILCYCPAGRKVMALRIGFVFLAALLLWQAPSMAQDLPIGQQLPPVAAPTHRVEVGQLPVLDTTPEFNAEAATAQWLARLGQDQRARSDAYTEGGYMLRMVNLIYGLGVAALLLWFQISARIRDWAEERTRSRVYQAMLYGVILVTAVTVLTLPLSIYEGYVREHSYGLSHQSFLQWAGDFAIRFTVVLAASIVFLPLFYAAIRATREAWWLSAAGLTIVAMVVGLSLYPLVIAPLFHHYTPLPDSAQTQPLLSLARANGVPADRIWVMDESAQSARLSSDVTGFIRTTRIVLSDNLLARSTPDEVLAVLGRQIGHYEMGHTLRVTLLMGLVILAGFAFVGFVFRFATGMFGGNWQVRRPDDVAGLPLLAALMGIFLFLFTPVTNSIVRTTERESDLFGVNTVRKPDAFASLVLKQSAYQKLSPSSTEETIYYDHPSGKSRIAMMMRWKAEHLRDLDVRDSVRNNPH